MPEAGTCCGPSPCTSPFPKVFNDIADRFLASFCFERLLACLDDLFRKRASEPMSAKLVAEQSFMQTWFCYTLWNH